MPQIQLPFFPEGVTQISDLLAFRVEDGRVAYFNGNTETAMANSLREQDRLARPDEARSLLQALYKTEDDILPDHEAGTLTVTAIKLSPVGAAFRLR